MAVNNNVVQISAGLSCTLLTDPPIGANGSTFTIGFTDGAAASDTYVTVLSGQTGNLNASPAGASYIKISNPSTSTGVTLKISSTTIGVLPAATSASVPSVAVFPIASDTVITATPVGAFDVTLGVTVIAITANA